MHILIWAMKNFIAGGLSVQLGTHGNVSLNVDGVEWLRSDAVSLQVASKVYRTSDGSLSLLNFSTRPDADRHGSFLATTWVWRAGPSVCSGGAVLETSVRVYGNDSLLVFRQAFPCTLELTPDASQWLASSWPSFVSATDAASHKSLGFNRSLTFNGAFLEEPLAVNGLAGCSVQTQGGVPLALFKAEGTRVGRSLLFSQHKRMKTAELSCGPAAAAPLAATQRSACRIVDQQHFDTLNTSKNDYEAFIPAGNGSYTKHIGYYCQSHPKDTWAYTGSDDNDRCQSRCTQMACACFDHLRSNAPPGPAPSPVAGPGHLSLGLKGTLTAVPKGFDAEWVAVLGDGILGSFEAWGDVLLESSGKRRWGPYDDVTASSVGWWTDNGGYYHYGGTDGKAGDFETQMHDALADHKQRGIPFKHWQLDSWFYPKGAGGNGSCCVDPPDETSTGSPHVGVFEWVADPFVFPAGIAALQERVKLPFVMHNRWYSADNWYRTAAKVGGEWVGNADYVLPLDLDGFWSFFFAQQQGFGLAVYEQDFMYTQYDNIAALQTNATFADDWLRLMAEHAARAGLSMQYCMPYGREYLVSTLHPNVVTIRASGDYHAGRDNYKISRSSLVAHAVGLLPFKDTFFTSSAIESGGADHDAEPNAQLHLIAATLSTSIVGPSDGKGLTNTTRLMGCCRSDGLVLKAERPAVPIDAVWTEGGPQGEISFSFACSEDNRTKTTYLLAADVEHDYQVTPHDLQLATTHCGRSDTPASAESYIVFDWATHRVAEFSDAKPLQLRRSKGAPHRTGAVEWSLSVVAPVLRGGWAVIGEPSKIVGASARRLRSARTLPSGHLAVVAVGVPMEEVEMCAVTAAMRLLCKSGAVGANGDVSFTFAAASA